MHDCKVCLSSEFRVLAAEIQICHLLWILDRTTKAKDNSEYC